MRMVIKICLLIGVITAYLLLSVGYVWKLIELANETTPIIYHRLMLYSLPIFIWCFCTWFILFVFDAI